MIDHVGIKVSNYNKSKLFYARALEALGYAVLMEFEGTSAGLGSPGKPDFWISEGEATAPVHLAFRAENRRIVDGFYAAAIAAGGRDNGKPGVREHYHPSYYAAFVFDPDGNNVEVVCHTPE